MPTLPDTDHTAALGELENLLEPRLEAARRGEWSEQTVDEIVAETLQEEQHS